MKRRLLSGKRLYVSYSQGQVNSSYDYSHTPISYNHRLPNKGEDPRIVESKKKPVSDILGVGSFQQFWISASEDPLRGRSTSDFFNNYPLINSKKLSRRSERPKRVKMLASDFIEDSLYNPQYGYFPKQATIFETESSFKYNDIKDTDDFVARWQSQYKRYGKDRTLQLWHTPVELFQPHYGEAIARYLLVNYKLNLYPYNDLIIYEIGGGNGTLMANILDYIRRMQPEVYSKTQYKIIDISKNLSEKQKKKGLRFGLKNHGAKVEFINKSILEWDNVVPEPCFVVGLEVIDNFAHDMIKYDIHTGQPYQGYVVIDEQGDYHQVFSPDLSEDTAEFLNIRGSEFLQDPKSSTMSGLKHPLNEFKLLTQLKNIISPFKNSLSNTEFIPTKLFRLFQVLNEKFPEHQLILSDFDSLPNASDGYNAPVVQTFLEDKEITTSTFMTEQGYFDIMFPTNFHTIRDLYINVCGRLIRTSKHSEFLEQWGDVEATTTKSGENPMLTFYQNASFLYN